MLFLVFEDGMQQHLQEYRPDDCVMDATEGWGLGGSKLLMTICIILSVLQEREAPCPAP